MPCAAMGTKLGLLDGNEGVSTVLISIGSNQGDSVTIARGAIAELAELAGGRFRASSLWRTSPVNCPAGSPDYVNASVAFTACAGESPESLLARLKALERRRGGRRPATRNAPRLLDLDLILFGDEVRDGPDLVLPHPRAVERRFVLEPSAEVAPDLRWPGTGRTIAELLAALRSDETVSRLGELSVF